MATACVEESVQPKANKSIQLKVLNAWKEMCEVRALKFCLSS